MLVAAAFGRERRSNESLDELAALAESAGLNPTDRIVCHRARPDPGLFIGSGKAEEIGAQVKADGIDYVLFDQPISAVQQRNLERAWGVRVLDRTELILDIFAQRARSHEGKLQVELARLEHQSSRLVRAWSHLERQRGGIGVRGGPGETQLEMDRRMIGDRIRQVRERLQRIDKQRRTRRRARARGGAFAVSLVGYTNAGKSTLFNALTGAGTYAADQLFATLDTLSRRLELGEGRQLVLSDTVGFVRDLPHQLVAAFRATLQETAEADLLLHVVDASAPDRAEQIEQVNRVLREIGAEHVPQLLVWNKIDVAGLPPAVDRDPCGNITRLFASARTGAGLDLLRGALVERLAGVDAAAASEADAGTGRNTDRHPSDLGAAA
ncbi:MAG TPA: GTPase HflX [Burkholderiaceae bacterium]|nr:GTPase HflX [Burkholderiaceae bacterium]